MKKRWTSKELHQLKAEAALGLSSESIAMRHGRTARSVYNKMHRLRRSGELDSVADSSVEITSNVKTVPEPVYADQNVMYFTIALTALNLAVLIANVLIRAV